MKKIYYVSYSDSATPYVRGFNTPEEREQFVSGFLLCHADNPYDNWVDFYFDGRITNKFRRCPTVINPKRVKKS